MKSWRVAGVISLSFLSSSLWAGQALLNASYDVSRELYKDINPAFTAFWQKTKGEAIQINQSHNGSSKQALSVAGGLEADVVSMNQSTDIDLLVERGGLVAKDWRSKFPNEAAPYTTTTVFLVRKSNPKGIKDWPDLAKPGTVVVIPNPKVTGNGRYTYLAAWGSVLAKGGSVNDAKAYVQKVFANVPVFDGGGRGASTTFTQRGIGDVLVTFENEAAQIAKELGNDQFILVYPSVSVEAPAPVAIVEKVVEKKGTTVQAKAYLDFLWSEEGQAIIAKHYFRPRSPAVLQKFAERFPSIKTFTVEEKFESWKDVSAQHFADGGIYDQLVERR